jgi:hypothetical protein
MQLGGGEGYRPASWLSTFIRWSRRRIRTSAIPAPDARGCFVLDPIPREEFKRRYPKAQIRDFTAEHMRVAKEPGYMDRVVGDESSSVLRQGKILSISLRFPPSLPHLSMHTHRGAAPRSLRPEESWARVLPRRPKACPCFRQYDAAEYVDFPLPPDEVMPKAKAAAMK